ncbi:KinB signaling pathway activation protein KbaA [Salinibacillus aidingensis]|uniref:KinB signaling pathway activation protein KbaA n=1 Tax=Salinibacillus aidingensis TaxID=237684 RepID=A0ABP3LMF3_9BACI
MTTQKWVHLFFKTLFLGAIAAIVTSFFVKTDSYTMFMDPINVWELFGALIWFMGIGFLFSVVSQTGFFAYLFLNRFGLNIFRGFWRPVQMVLIAFVLFDLVYFPYQSAGDDANLGPYVLTALVLFLYGMAVAYFKAKETNQKAFLPAVFFMVVVTVIEWVPVLRTNQVDWMWLMIVPLLVCNTYQLMQLHRLTRPNEEKPAVTAQSRNTNSNVK